MQIFRNLKLPLHDATTNNSANVQKRENLAENKSCSKTVLHLELTSKKNKKKITLLSITLMVGLNSGKETGLKGNPHKIKMQIFRNLIFPLHDATTNNSVNVQKRENLAENKSCSKTVLHLELTSKKKLKK